MKFNEKLLAKLNIETNNSNLSEKILLSSIKRILDNSQTTSIHDFLLKTNDELFTPLKNLSLEEIDYLDKEMLEEKNIIPIEECQVLVQKQIPTQKRKSLASYFTVDIGITLMAKASKKYYHDLYSNENKKIVISDPFLGSARTLTKVIKEIGIQNIEKVIGFEPYFLSSLVAYSALLDSTKGQVELEVFNDDAFSLISNFSLSNELNRYKVDIVLTNPPFTRWSNMSESYREKVMGLVKNLDYLKWLTRKDASLQIFSMFLTDHVLKENGLLISVLPASTFYATAGEGYKSLLKKKYELKAILENGSSSFSEDSGFKEIILVAKKTNKPVDTKTIFKKIDSTSLDNIVESIFSKEEIKENSIDLAELSKIEFIDRNWSFLFKDPEFRTVLLKIIEQGQKNRTLVKFNEIFNKEDLIRGIEMYGTDFFFIPNKYWITISDSTDYLMIKNTNDGKEIKIDKLFLEKVLRQPKNYSDKLLVNTDSYVLSISPDYDLTEDIKKYIDFGIKSKTADMAIKAREKHWPEKMGMWYSHINYQINTKQPFGNVFLPDKVDTLFKNRGVFANYTESKTIATKNFHEIKVENVDIQKILSLWYNSSIFLSIFLSTGKKISDRYIRMLGIDHQNCLTLNADEIENSTKEEMLTFFDKIKYERFPPLKQQYSENKFHQIRYELDYLVLKAICVEEKEETLKNLHKWMKVKLTEEK